VEIVRVHEHISGGGFDLAPVRPHFESYVKKQGLSERVRFHPGNFLHDPLPSADVMIMGRVLHNWNVSTKTTLLKKAYNALPPTGALIVYERMIDDARQVSAPGLLSSLNMLIMTEGGFDYTVADLTVWMRDAGFHDLRLERLTSEISMLVGTK
jgi:hypothetical protein